MPIFQTLLPTLLRFHFTLWALLHGDGALEGILSSVSSRLITYKSTLRVLESYAWLNLLIQYTCITHHGQLQPFQEEGPTVRCTSE